MTTATRRGALAARSAVAGTTPAAVLTAAAWKQQALDDVDESTLHAAQGLARDNQVEGLLARCYPERLAVAAATVAARTAAFRTNLSQAAALLLDVDVQAILIKADPTEDYEYSNFDLVVGRDGWKRALAALEGVTRRATRDASEPNKLILHLAERPAIHLHAAVSWFNVPIIPLDKLRARATRKPGESWWTPDPVDSWRIIIAHAAFQNLAFDLRDLVELRKLLQTKAVMFEGLAQAKDEGWERGYWLMLESALRAMVRLDASSPAPLPVATPVVAATKVAVEHSSQLWRDGRRTAALREAALRPALIVAKRRRRTRW